MTMEEQMNREEHLDDEEEDMERWTDSNQDMIEWMTEAVKFPVRSDCG